MSLRYPVARPVWAGNEEQYVLDCLRSTRISSSGPYLERFEAAFAGHCGARHALACSSGTAALHLALLALGVGPGDEILVPSLTFVAVANAVAYCGARPVFVDSEPLTWTLDAARLAEAVTPRTRGVIAVHLYGHPADMDAVTAVAQRHGIFVVEDAAEAHGAVYRGRTAGSLGDVATFSFYGNKVVTTGEGGMVVTSDSRIADRVARLRGQGMEPARRYWFPERGYNYRMPNLLAAVGLAQLERIEWHVERRRQVAAWYAESLAGQPGLRLQPELDGCLNSRWMNCVELLDPAASRDGVMARLATAGIETRPFFPPMHTLPMYSDGVDRRALRVAEQAATRGLNLPSHAALEQDDVRHIAREFLAAVAPGQA